MAASLALSQQRATQLGLGASLLSLCVIAVIAGSPYVVYLNYLFPLLCLLLGSWFYLTNPGLYYGFTWWTWFITPFVRRYVDYEVGFYNPASYIMLTPLLVTGLSAFTVLRYANRFQKSLYHPLLLALGGVVYAYAVGVMRNGPFAATLGLFDWLFPLLFACHILLHGKHYLVFRQVTRSVFTWGVLVMGVYGIVQYFSPLPWDQFWMVNSGMTTIGKPEPFAVRVFSTLNSPGPFAGIMMVGLIVLFDARGVVSLLSLVPGYVSFMLTLVRGAWGGFAVALFYAITRLQSRLRLRMIAVLAVGTVLSLPLLMHEAVSDKVSSRVETFGNLHNDRSLSDRSALYSVATVSALTEPLGRGLGSFGRAANFSEDGIVSFDSGILIIPFTLGWLGTVLYLFGLFWIGARILRTSQKDADQFTVIAGSVAVAMFARLFLSNQLTGIFGLVMWTFMVLAVMGRRHYEKERTATVEPEPAPADAKYVAA